MKENIELLIEELQDLQASGDWTLYEDVLHEAEDMLSIEPIEDMEQLEVAVEDLERVLQGIEDNDYSDMVEPDSFESLGLNQRDFIQA